MNERTARLNKVKALAAGKQKKPVRKLTRIAVNNIIPDPDQDRKNIQGDDWPLFVESIRSTDGPIQPILVVEIDHPDAEYMIRAGERRWRACIDADIATIDAIIIENDNEYSIEQLIENVSKQPLSPLETANAFKRRIDAGLTYDELANAIGVSASRIKQRLALLNYPPNVQALAEDGVVAHPNRLATLRKLAENAPDKFAEVEQLLRSETSYDQAMAQVTASDDAPAKDAQVPERPPGANAEEANEVTPKANSNKPLPVPQPVLVHLFERAGIELDSADRKELQAAVTVIEKQLSAAQDDG